MFRLSGLFSVGNGLAVLSFCRALWVIVLLPSAFVSTVMMTGFTIMEGRSVFSGFAFGGTGVTAGFVFSAFPAVCGIGFCDLVGAGCFFAKAA